jgi:hypothetical protein
MHIYYGTGTIHLIAKEPRLSFALAALLVGGGMYTGHRMVHAAAAAPVQVSGSQHRAPTVKGQVSVKFLGESQGKNR